MPVPEFSQMLTDRRRQLGYSVGQAARALRLKESVLEAFESGDFASMPKSGYAQGMLSSYARFLGLDAQLVTDLFAESLDEWRAETQRGARRSPSHGSRRTSPGARRPQPSRQPQVPRRGLLPTAGGIAGDLGDYATTSRAHPHSYGGSYESGSASRGRDFGRNARAVRDERASGEALRRRSRSRGRDDVTTVPVSSEYVDDLRFGNHASPYDPASSESGRASYRNLASTERPQVQRRPSSRQRQQVRGRGHRQEPQTFAARLTADPVRFIGIIVVLVAVIITLILIMAVSSCSLGTTRGDGNRSVPVSQTTTSSSTDNGSSGSSNSGNANGKSAEEAAAERQIASQSANTGDGDDNTATVVEVSVADGSVTWLEIECDGSSKVAETVTGPWDQTYTVTESITIQVGDTTAVTVTKNGKQMQFDSRASGLGTITIQGTKVETPQTSAAAGTNSTRTTTGAGADGSSNANGSSAASASGDSGSGAAAGSTSTDGVGSAAAGGTSASSSGSGAGSGSSTAASGGAGSSGSRPSGTMGRAGTAAASDGGADSEDSSSYSSSGDYSDYSDSAY